MSVGGWGDPALYVRKQNSLNLSNPRYGVYMARWSDNKPGSDGLAELLLLNMQTTTHTVKFFYTNKNRMVGNRLRGRLIESVRVEVNGVSTTYTNSAKVAAGPISIRIAKSGSGANVNLGFDLSWSTINNLVSLKGALSIILKRVATTRGYWNGGSGALRDGLGIAASIYGLSRSSFHTTNLSMLSMAADELTSEDSSGFAEAAAETTNETLYHADVTGIDANGDETPSYSNDIDFAENDTRFANNVGSDDNPSYTPEPYAQLMPKTQQISW